MMTTAFRQSILLLLILATGTMPVDAASIVLREQAIPSGSVVFLGDIADIAAASEDEKHNLATTPLMAAPAHGTQEFLHFAKVLDLLEGRGIDVSDLSFAGAQTVEIGKATPVEVPVAVEPIRQLSPEECEEAVSEAVKTYLIAATGHPDWEFDVRLGDTELRQLVKLGHELTASAGKSPWIGAQRFQIAGDDKAQPVFVFAQVAKLRNVVVATRRIEQGNLIGASDVELRLKAVIPTTAVHTLDLVIGKEAVRAIEADTILQGSFTRSPLLVQRGETVKVFARTGGISVSTFAVVQQNGSLGDLVQVQTLDKKDRFAARVSGWKQLEVLPTGVTTADYEAANHPATQKR